MMYLPFLLLTGDVYQSPQKEAELHENFSVLYEQHMTLNLNHLVSRHIRIPSE